MSGQNLRREPPLKFKENLGYPAENCFSRTCYFKIDYLDDLWVKKSLTYDKVSNSLSREEANILLKKHVVRGAPAHKIKSLILKGADPNMKMNTGESLLIVAVKKNFFYVARILIKYGADKKFKDSNGLGALDYARKNKNYNIIDILN